jgi:NAD(P)-dependent dehydrogenase (short-subunit alcohol dehydrogenase family)
MGWSPADIPDLTGRRAVVTGANSGLGLETALGLSRAGAHVTLACRNLEKAEVARERIVREAPASRPRVLHLDLADLDSVRDLAERLLAEGKPVDSLVNNAGLMAVDEARTAQGLEMQYGVNHLGHFARQPGESSSSRAWATGQPAGSRTHGSSVATTGGEPTSTASSTTCSSPPGCNAPLRTSARR